MLAHSPRAVDLASYASSSSAIASPSTTSSPKTRHSPSQQPVVPCPDDSDFLDSDADGEACEAEDEFASAGTQGSHATTALEPDLAPEVGLIHVSHRLYFTYFADTPPSPDHLNRGDGSASALFEAPTRQTRPGQIQPEYPEKYHWFNIDDDLVYLSFFEDWGPLNVALFYRFCMHTHQLLNDPSLADRAFVFYTSENPTRKANGSLLAAMYSMIIDHIEPADAFHPFSQLEFRPFRDAGYGRADYYLTIQDILYGVHRAIEEKLLDLSTFSLEEYEHYEQVQNGDWNWITPSFLAFASPNDREYVAEIKANGGILPASGSRMGRKLPKVITNTVRYFKERNIQLVVRLNNPLYDKEIFEEAGIQHVDMYFDDGSNPSEEILRDFIRRAHKVIQKGGSIAVHCKAGLGRTGVLIGAYLIWRYGFSASEVIGFMRIMRPGCVVGPQQHFMYQNFAHWIRWSVRDQALAQARKLIETERAQLSERRLSMESSHRPRKRQSEEGLDDVEGAEERSDSSTPVTPLPRKLPRVIPATAAPAIKPVPCVGQPRKSPSPSRKRPVNILQESTVRLCPATLQPTLSTNELPRSHSEEALSTRGSVELGKIVGSDSNCGSGVTSLRDSWEKLAGVASPPRSPKVDLAGTPTATTTTTTTTAPVTSSRVLAEAQRLNVATPERNLQMNQKDVNGTPTAVTSVRSVNSTRPAHERSRSEASPCGRHEAAPSPVGTPRAARVPSFAASPHVKAAYGLKPTPRSSPQPQKSGGHWVQNGEMTGSSEDSKTSSSSQQSTQSDAEVLGVLGVNFPVATAKTTTTVAETTTTRPSVRKFGRTPSSSMSISPAKIRAPIMSAGMAAGTSGRLATTLNPSSSSATSAVSSRPMSGKTAAPTSTTRRSASGSSSSSSTGAPAASSRVRPATTSRNGRSTSGNLNVNVNVTGVKSDPVGPASADRLQNCTTLRKTSRSGANSLVHGNGAPASAAAAAAAAAAASETGGNNTSSSGNSAMLAARANLKRARPSPDVLQGEFTHGRGVGVGIGAAGTGGAAGARMGTRPVGGAGAAAMLKKTNAGIGIRGGIGGGGGGGAMSMTSHPTSIISTCLSSVNGAPGSGPGSGSSRTATPATTTATTTTSRVGRNVRRRRSSLGAADIGMA